jgi:hypothetical protein
MPTSEELRDRAEQLLELAMKATDPRVRQMLLIAAEEFKRAAEQLDANARLDS